MRSVVSVCPPVSQFVFTLSFEPTLISACVWVVITVPLELKIKFVG